MAAFLAFIDPIVRALRAIASGVASAWFEHKKKPTVVHHVGEDDATKKKIQAIAADRARRSTLSDGVHKQRRDGAEERVDDTDS